MLIQSRRGIRLAGTMSAAFVCLGVALLAPTQVHAQSVDEGGCPTLRHGYGPYDYRNATRDQKVLVEGAHFFPNVENLRKGTSHPNKGYIVIPGAEIDYTLRAFPNHPRALLSLSRLSSQEKKNIPTGVKAPVECYFLAAIKFRPDDSMVRVIYGIHLSKTGKTEEAIREFDKARELGGESANLYYNLGLAYFEIKRYEESLAAAHRAYSLGFPLPGLRSKLESVKAWRDPEPKRPAATKETMPAETDNGSQDSNEQPRNTTKSETPVPLQQ